MMAALVIKLALRGHKLTYYLVDDHCCEIPPSACSYKSLTSYLLANLKDIVCTTKLMSIQTESKFCRMCRVFPQPVTYHRLPY